MLFKKNNAKPNTTATEAENESSEKTVMTRLRKRMRLQFVFMIIALVALCSSSYAFVTQAWYSNNRETTSTDNTITSDVATTSLFISPGTTVDGLYSLGLVKTWPNTAKLFPISTRDCATWWYVDRFTPTLNAGGTAYEAKASHYTSASTTVTDGVATYDNTLDGNGKVAYVVSEYMLYTNNSPLNVFLNPDNPITVAYASNEATQKLLGALRVGVEFGGSLKFIYAPVTESGTGNSDGQTVANTFYGVTNATTVDTLSTSTAVITSVSGFAATATGSDVEPYSAGSATALGQATTAGIQVRVYIWLEGTDAQAMLGVSDNDLQGINVNIKYVGVTPSN